MREGPGECVLDGGQADHFAADFGKALGSAANPEVAIFVLVDDVPGVVPAVERLERVVGVLVQVALHDVRPLDEQAAGILHAVDRLKFAFYARQQPPD